MNDSVMKLVELRPYADLCSDVCHALEKADVDALAAWPRVLCALSVVARCRANGETVDHLGDIEIGKAMSRREAILTDIRDALLTATPDQAREWLKYFDWLCQSMNSELKRILLVS